MDKWRYQDNQAQLRLRKWKSLQKRLMDNSFYAKFIHSNTKISDLPILNKKLFMENFNQINSVNINLEDALKVAEKAEKSRDFTPTINGITVGLSSGTSGNRGVFLASQTEKAKWVAAVLDRVIGFSIKKRRIAFFLRANSNLYNSVNSNLLEFNFFDLLVDLDQHIKRLNTLQPQILVAQPSLLLKLANALESQRLQIHPNKIISVAEVLYPEDKQYLESVFDQIIHQVYQCTEGFLASTCKYGTLHFHEDLFLIEKKYLDKEEKKFHPIITDLERNSQYFIRYELNDIITEKEHCKCMSNWTAIESIEGRSDDIFEFINNSGDKVSIFPDFFRRSIISASKEIQDYRLIQKGHNELELYVDNTYEIWSVAKAEILNLLNEFKVEQINIIRVEKISHRPDEKFRRIKNEMYESV